MLITDGQKTLSVTKGAYRSFFKELGFKPVTPMPVEQPEDMEPDEETMLDELYEKPLSEMDFSELKLYAESLGLNANGLKSKRELREAIRAAEQDD